MQIGSLGPVELMDDDGAHVTHLYRDWESPAWLHWQRPDGGLTGAPGRVAGCRPTAAPSQP